jgi:lipopolysaccharide transport system ATP-binding protein
LPTSFSQGSSLRAQAAVALRVDDIGKQYRLGLDPVSGSLRDRVGAWRTPGRKAASETFWALRHVTFEIAPGTVLGVIGGNGAGKSTLLKILSRITAPTEGRAEIYGHVGSLLEVGTGFHPDLTGRENVFLNGAILGMRRVDIERRFDSIVEFAEIERFIDTPVKRYSSGMHLRLAFSVAAHLEPEILLVDEVLAVGDARFQKKCLGKLHEVAGSGRTVLFVSHNLAAVQRLCTDALVLDRGEVVFRGTPRDAVRTYLQSGAAGRYVARRRSRDAQVTEACLVDASGHALTRVTITEPVTIEMKVALPDDAAATRLGIGLLDAEGATVMTSNLDDVEMRLPAAPAEFTARVTLPANSLLAGNYHVVTCLWNESRVIDLQEPAFAFAADPGTSPLYRRDPERKGVLHVPCDWQLTTHEVAAVQGR